MKAVFIFLFCLFLTINAKPKKTAEDTLEDTFHDEKHGDEDGEDHNSEYDHESFVGKDEAPGYDELTPEQSKEKLGELYHKVDKMVKEDGQVTEEELKLWIKFTQNRYVTDDSEKQMKNNDLNRDGKITFEEYKNGTYGYMTEENQAEHEDDSFKTMIVRDETRYKKADKDQDGALNLAEYTAFLHPENDPDMKGVVVQETLDDIDKDKDGFITLDEYIGDLWPEEEQKNGDAEPDWVASEREQFNTVRDMNGDGKMDAKEVSDWIMPDDMDHVDSEAKHLISESDTNKDGTVSKEEMLDKVDLYVGSQATDFGDALKTTHDPEEL